MMKRFALALVMVSISLTNVSITNATPVTLTAIDDAYVYKFSPDSNYGSENYLKVYNGEYYSYLKFDLSAVPDGSTINPATIKLMVPFQVYAINDPYAKLIDMHYVTSDAWSESTISWNNKPSSSTNKISSQYTSFTPIYTVFDIWLAPSAPPSGYEVWNYNADLADNKFSVVLKTQSYGTYYFYSSENNSYRPELTFDYTPLDGGGIVPEPATLFMFCLGLQGIAVLRKVGVHHKRHRRIVVKCN